MTRISEFLLVQQIEDDDHGDRYVIADQSSGAEIVLTADEAGRVLYVLGTYFGLPVVGPNDESRPHGPTRLGHESVAHVGPPSEHGGEGMTKHYDVLDQNGDTLESFDSWGLATTYLRTWETDLIKGNIRDNDADEFELYVLGYFGLPVVGPNDERMHP